MASYIATRFVRMITVVFAVTLFAFFLLNLLPGSPINAILGAGAGDAAARAQVSAQLGLNHPLAERYFIWLGHALQGNLGVSYVSNQSVLSAIGERIPLTLELMVMAEVISIVLAVPTAMGCALKPGGWFDTAVNQSSLAVIGLPAFALGPLLIYIFSVKLHLLLATGVTTWFTIGKGTSPAIVATPLSLLLPSITLALGQIAVFSRVLRGDLIGTLKSDFIRMAQAKGLSRKRIMLRHALRPSSFSFVSLLGLSIGGLLAGALIVENVFGLPGMGTLLVTAIEKRDYLMVQGIIVMFATGFVTVNFVTDAMYGVLDPRVRRARVGR